jgi:hypothetical protein
MGNVNRLAEEVRRGLEAELPWLSKAVLRKLPLAVAAMVEARTPNTRVLAANLPLETEREDRREQWLRRLLSSPALASDAVLAPFARETLSWASEHEQTVILAMDQTELGGRFAILMVSVRVGERALPLAWWVEEGEANLGFSAQRDVLERIRGWLPNEAAVMVLADRFYGSADLLR